MILLSLSDDLDGEDLLSQMLVFEPSERIAASVSLKHRYFASLPEAIHHLMPSKTKRRTKIFYFGQIERGLSCFIKLNGITNQNLQP